ncbi:MAG: DNA glycosylase AlkZ-like family protein, partial [Candidatus Rokuibacteriota bacterium]
LLERALPDAFGVEPVSAVEFQRWHIARSLRAMGAATELDLARYLTFPRFRPGTRRAALRQMLEAGEITEIELEGSAGRWLTLTGDLPALARAERSPAPSRGTTFLTPFDSLMWHRDRVARLFGFDYRIEVYTPGPERVHGYYTLPILHHGHLIGRVDAKSHRADRRLEARHVHFEPWFATAGTPPRAQERLDQDEAIAGVATALRSLATFVGADAVKLRRVTPSRLRPALVRWLGARPDESPS